LKRNYKNSEKELCLCLNENNVDNRYQEWIYIITWKNCRRGKIQVEMIFFASLKIASQSKSKVIKYNQFFK